MYYCTTWQESRGMSLIFLVRKIPLPWQEFIGLTIKVIGFFFSCMKFINSYDSAGKIQVLGKKLNYRGSSFCISFKYLARLFFNEIIVIPGKWLIFWYGFRPFSLPMWKSESSQRMSQSALACVNAADPVSLSGFQRVHRHPKVFFAICLMIS